MVQGSRCTEKLKTEARCKVYGARKKLMKSKEIDNKVNGARCMRHGKVKSEAY
jgi:hypothetical protein